MDARRQLILDSIKSLVGDNKTDHEIAAILSIEIKEVYYFRKNVLKISLYNKKIVCQKCGQKKKVTCFNKDTNHPDWCIQCRRKYDGEIPAKKLGRPHGSKSSHGGKPRRFIKVVCIRCDKPFTTEIFIGHNGRDDHYRACKKCRFFIDSMERCSI